jgi:type II secretory pathway pseudopilin PulG
MSKKPEQGVALIAVLTAILLLSALSAALVMVTSTEVTTAAGFQQTSEAAYAADAVAQHALGELAKAPNWSGVLAGGSVSVFNDGTPGTRTLADGTTIDLREIVSIASCDKPAPCTAAEMDASTPERPWGRNNPRWQVYASGTLQDLQAGAATAPPYYVVLLVGDDPGENDDNPAADGGPPANGEPANEGLGRLSLRAESFGPGGAHGRVDLTVSRMLRVVSWREVP